MHGSRWLRLGFFAAAGLQVAALFLDRRLVPYSGTFAMAALLAMAWVSPAPSGASRWSRPAALAGLALLTLTAFLVDNRTDGYGWPFEFPEGDNDTALREPALFTAGAGTLAAAVLGRTARVFRWRHCPAFAFAIVTLAAIGNLALRPTVHSGETPPNLTIRALVLLSAGLAIAALALALNAALASRSKLRPAGAGLLALMVLGLSGVLAMASNDLISARPVPAAETLTEPLYRLVPPSSAYQSEIWVELQPRPFYPWTFEVSDEYLAEWEPEEPVVEEKRDIEAVSGPPSWAWSLWQGDSDWARPLPALQAAVLLSCLVALVTSLFQVSTGRPGDRI